METQTITKNMFYCPEFGVIIPKENCPEICACCSEKNRNGQETFHWSG